MRWPRTRYMLMRVWTWTCLTRRRWPPSPASSEALASLCQRTGCVGDVQRLEDLVVEVVLAHQALGHVGEEQARLGALDDPVVVGRGEGHRLADAQVGQRAGVGGLEPGRDAQGADARR